MRVKIRVARSTDTIVQTMEVKGSYVKPRQDKRNGTSLCQGMPGGLLIHSSYSLYSAFTAYLFYSLVFSDCELLGIYTTGVIDLAANPAKDGLKVKSIAVTLS